MIFHVNVALVASDRERFLLRLLCTLRRGEGTTTSLFIISSRLLKFLCVCFVFRVLYIYKTLEEIGNREITRNGEKKSFEVGGLNDSTHIDYYHSIYHENDT